MWARLTTLYCHLLLKPPTGCTAERERERDKLGLISKKMMKEFPKLRERGKGREGERDGDRER